jgi:hypothetical protein
MEPGIHIFLSTVGIGLLFSFPMVLIQNWLISIGAVRNGIPKIVIGVFLMVLIRQIWFQNMPWLCWGPLIVIGGILSLNRGDLWDTMEKGTWWWKLGQDK